MLLASGYEKIINSLFPQITGVFCQKLHDRLDADAKPLRTPQTRHELN